MIADDVARTLLLDAYLQAQKSKDPSTQNGAVMYDLEHAFIKDPIKGIATGWNRMPKGIADTPEHWARPLKYKYVVHAEEAAILDCAARGIATKGKLLVVAWAACTDCAKAIIEAEIGLLVTHRLPQEHGGWSEDILLADQMFEENLSNLKELGVRVQIVEGKIDITNQICVRRNGEPLYP